MPHKKWVLSIMIACMLVVTGVATGEATSEVSVNVTAIMASREATYVDPDLEFVANEFEPFFAYSSFRKVSSYNVMLSEGSSDQIILPHDNNLVVSYIGSKDESISLHIQLGDVLDTDCTLVDGGHILVGGPEFETGVLILLFEAGMN